MSAEGVGLAVVESREVAVGELVSHPDNPRQGDVGAIVESLRAHGQYRALVVNRRNMRVLAGNHTVAALRALGAESALVDFVDVDEASERRIMLVDNRTPDLASYDDQVLADVLRSLPDLEGTGYDGSDLDDLLLRLADPVGPEAFADPEPAAMSTDYECPSCGYRWSGMRGHGEDAEAPPAERET